MDLTSVRCLHNSISRFIHLVACRASGTLPLEKDFRNVASSLKRLKHVLDEVSEYKVPINEDLCKECEELDIAINEAREFIEKWSMKKSKILCVLQGDRLLLKMQSLFVQLSRNIRELMEPSPLSTSSLSDIQHLMQEFQSLKLDTLSEHVEKALVSLKEGKVVRGEQLMEIIEPFQLALNHGLLNECIALEKEKTRADENKQQVDLVEIDLIIFLMSRIRDCLSKVNVVKGIKDVKVPPYFRCPLSLEIMSDPVIVASGQTYDRSSIQKWLDNGLTICPITRQKLMHSNLIPNYTVKALISNWLEENNVNVSVVPSESEDSFKQDTQQCSVKGNNSAMCGDGVDPRRVDGKAGSNEEFSDTSIMPARKYDCSSGEHSYSHSRSGSASTAVSSNDYIPTASNDARRTSSKHGNASDTSGDLASDCTSSSLNKVSTCSPSLSVKQYHSSKTMAEVSLNVNHNPSRSMSFPAESVSNDLTTTSHVENLIKDLKSQSTELQTASAAELRYLSKHNMENRVTIGQCGAIAPLIALLHSDVKLTQEHAVTALLNLSIHENIKVMIAEQGALDPITHVLRTGNAGAKENAAAAIFSLSLLEEYRIKIGRSSAVKALIDLLGSGTIRGKKDAATALFNLSIFHENKARIVQAGAVKYLIELLDPSNEMVDKAVALLANLSTIPEGCSAIAREGGIPLLVEIVETGSQRGKENAASILLQLCLNSPKYCRLVLQEGAVPPLVALSQSGSPRAKEKAQQLLGHFRNQREGGAGRGKT